MDQKRQLGFVFTSFAANTLEEISRQNVVKEENIIPFRPTKADRVKAELIQQLERSGILIVGRTR